MIEKKILFITSRNIINTCGELRLIKNRTRALESEWKIKTDFIAFSNKKRDKKKKEKIGANSSIMVCNYTQYNIIDIISTFFRVRKLANSVLKEDKYIAIVLSGMIVLSYAKYFKKNFPEIKIVADIHGAYEELIEFKDKSLIRSNINRLVYRIAMIEQKRSLPSCDSAFVVSKALKRYVIKNFKINNLKFFIIPCSQSRSENSFDNALSNRIKWRKELNVSDNELLFIYSGGISPWQSIEEATYVFQTVKQRLPNKKIHFLIMSHDASKLNYLASEDITIKAFKPEDVKNVLYAGDYAFLLRGDYVTNNVAFPNKFFEYVLSGMNIICTPHVHDINHYVKNYQLGIILETLNQSEIDKIIVGIKNALFSKAERPTRLVLANKLSFENTLKPFVSYILLN